MLGTFASGSRRGRSEPKFGVRKVRLRYDGAEGANRDAPQVDHDGNALKSEVWANWGTGGPEVACCGRDSEDSTDDVDAAAPR